MDIIYQLGALAFATRLKRLSDRLSRDVSQVYSELEVDFEARWFTILYALSKKENMSITGLAEALGLTHPAVNQIAAEMTARGLLVSNKDKLDERKRLLSLSAEGKKTLRILKPIWKEIEQATGELLGEANGNLLLALKEIEEALNRKEMYARLAERLNLRDSPVDIVEYRPSYKKFFKSLNYEWLTKYFSVEPYDEKILSDPNGKIIRPGGAALFARQQDKIVGVCALIKHSSELFELAKMAVTENSQGKGIGRKLALAIIEKASSLGGKRLFLETSPKLTAAIALYESLGFSHSERSPVKSAQFERCSVSMILTL
ncbi:MAG: MarR family transcriptional regulator [candidate division Zixibacteria bacterium]|nr:MarR family transcriptional regulator [candidate division Zixibacteria bacterium]